MPRLVVWAVLSAMGGVCCIPKTGAELSCAGNWTQRRPNTQLQETEPGSVWGLVNSIFHEAVSYRLGWMDCSAWSRCAVQSVDLAYMQPWQLLVRSYLDWPAQNLLMRTGAPRPAESPVDPWIMLAVQEPTRARSLSEAHCAAEPGR